MPAADDARGMMEYLVLSRYRPVGLQQLIEDTKGRFDKGVMVAMLDQLERKDVVKAKQIGTSKMWYPAKMATLKIDEVNDLRRELQSLEAEAKSLDGQGRKLRARTAALEAEPVDVGAAVAGERRAVATLGAKVSGLRSVPKGGNYADVAAEYNNRRSAWILRKRGYAECVETLAEALDMPPKRIVAQVEEAVSHTTDPADNAVPAALKNVARTQAKKKK